jgi:hypothetical protein
MAFTLLIVLVVVMVLIPAATFVRAHVSARDISWLAGSSTPPQPEAEVYARYLARHRRHRVVGGLFGILLAAVVGGRWYGTVGLGVGQQSPLADLLFCGLAGVLVGALSAESFRLSQPVSSTVSASLAEHPGAARPDLIRVARSFVVAALVAGVLIAMTGHGLAALGVALGGLFLAAVAEATQAAISGRRRPVLSDRAREVDLRMRGFASTSVAWLQLAAAVLVAAWVLAKAPGFGGGPPEVIQTLAVLAGLIATIVLLRRAAPRPPRFWVAATP